MTTTPLSPVGRVRQLLASDALRNKLAGPGLAALIVKVAGAGLSYVMLVAFARMMDAAAYGRFGVLLNAAIVISAIAACGLPTGAMKFWPGHIARKEPALALGFHAGAQKLLLLTSGVLLLLALAGIWLWPASRGGLTAGEYIGVAALAGLFGFGDYFGNMLRAQDRVLWSMVPRDVFWRIATPGLAFVVLLAFKHLTAADAIATCVVAMALVIGSQAFVSQRAARHIAGQGPGYRDWSSWRRSLVPLAGASILYAMVQQLDVVVVGGFLGPEEAGAYFAAQKTASLLGLVMIAGGMVAAPMMSAHYQAGQLVELQKLCKWLALAIAAATGAGLLVLAILGKPLLSVFDPAYQSAYIILMVLALGYALDALAGPTAYLMQMTSLEGTYLRIMAIVYGLVLALQFVFVPRYGAIAAAACTAFGVALWNILAIYHLRKSIGVDSSILSFLLPSRAAQQELSKP